MPVMAYALVRVEKTPTLSCDRQTKYCGYMRKRVVQRTHSNLRIVLVQP